MICCVLGGWCHFTVLAVLVLFTKDSIYNVGDQRSGKIAVFTVSFCLKSYRTFEALIYFSFSFFSAGY